MNHVSWLLVLAGLMLGGCGAKTPISGGFEGLDVVEEEELAAAKGAAGSGNSGGSSAAGGSGAAGSPVTPGPLLEDCYTPGKDGRPPTPCLQIDDELLPPLFSNCPSPAVIKSGPIIDINVTLGTTRCCYEISSETCE
jgi:hypothetical protein